MRKNNSILFIGGCGHGKVTTNGVSAKNYYLLRRLREFCDKVAVVDTDGWNRNPIILFKLILFLIVYHNYQLVISLNPGSAYLFIRFISIIFPKRKICYFVIGGNLPTRMKNENIRPYQKCVKWFLVESQTMKEQMEQMGFTNTLHVPNFKNITHIPVKAQHGNSSTHIRYVFLSRIIPEKGCDYILDACKLLNDMGYSKRFSVSFYGPLDKVYKTKFLHEVQQTTNVEYKGFLDLRNDKNYDTLAEYDAMLFPTYWHGEGFPGIVIDAFIAGVPVIATDWRHNKEFIHDHQTGILIPPYDVQKLSEVMKQVIDNPSILQEMNDLCQKQAMYYDVHHILTDSLFEMILKRDKK